MTPPPSASSTLSLLPDTSLSPSLSVTLTLSLLSLFFFFFLQTHCLFVLSSVQILLFFTPWFLHLDSSPTLDSVLILCQQMLSVHPPALHFVSSVWQSRNVILTTGLLLLMVELCFYCFWGFFLLSLFVPVCHFPFLSFCSFLSFFFKPVCAFCLTVFVLLTSTSVCMLLKCKLRRTDSLRTGRLKDKQTNRKKRLELSQRWRGVWRRPDTWQRKWK